MRTAHTRDGRLAYLDFGLVSEVPAEVRDGLVAAVTLLVFSRDYEGVASLFGDLQLVPRDVLENEYQFRGLVQSLKDTVKKLQEQNDELRRANALASAKQHESPAPPPIDSAAGA